MFLKDIHTYTYTLGVKNTTESGRMWEILVVSVEQMQNMDRTMGHGRLPERGRTDSGFAEQSWKALWD